MLNKVMIIGNLGNDPEIKMTPSGQKVASFNVAVTEKYTDKSGQKRESTEWVSIVIWGKLSEVVEKYVKKGSKLYLEGKLKTRSWDDATSGQKRYKTEVVCNQMTMLGGRSESTQSVPQAQSAPEPLADLPQDELPF